MFQPSSWGKLLWNQARCENSFSTCILGEAPVEPSKLRTDNPSEFTDCEKSFSTCIMGEASVEPSKLRKELLTPGLFATGGSNQSGNRLPPIESKGGSRDSLMPPDDGASNCVQRPPGPFMGAIGIGGKMDRLIDQFRKFRAESATRQQGLTRGKCLAKQSHLEVLESVKDWVHVENVRTGRKWFYNKESERIKFERPFDFNSVQEMADRQALRVLKEVPPEKRTQPQLAALSWTLKASFQQVGVDALQEACRNMKWQRNGPQEVIMWQGDVADSFYFLLRGSVSVWITPEDAPPLRKEICETGGPVNQIRVVTLGPNTGFGEQGLVYDAQRNASIVTEGCCDFAILEKKDFSRALKDHFIKAAQARCQFLELYLPVINKQSDAYGYIAGFFKEVSGVKGQAFCETGKKNETLDIIYEGKCNVCWHSRMAPGGDASKSQKFTVCELGVGQVLNVTSVLLDRPEVYDVIVTSGTLKVLRMQKADCMSRLPPVMRELLVEAEHLRISTYSDLAKRADICSTVEGLSASLLAHANMRRKSLELQREEMTKVRDSLANAKSLNNSATSMSDHEETSSGFSNAESSPRTSTLQIFEGLQKNLRSLQRRNTRGLVSLHPLSPRPHEGPGMGPPRRRSSHL